MKVVSLNFNGVLREHPCAYVGGDHCLFTDVDFVGMDVFECVEFVERFTIEAIESLYYCLRTHPLANGIWFI